MFLPDLFRGVTYQIHDRAVNVLPVNKTGTDIPDPTQTSRSNWTVSSVITVHLIAVLCGTVEYQSGDRSIFMGEVRKDISWRHDEDAEMALGESQAASSTEDSY